MFNAPFGHTMIQVHLQWTLDAACWMRWHYLKMCSMSAELFHVINAWAWKPKHHLQLCQ